VGDFTELAPLETTSRTTDEFPVHRIDALRFGIRAGVALTGGVESRTTYRVLLAEGATIVTRASIDGDSNDQSARVEFTLTVRSRDQERSVREVLGPGRGGRRTVLFRLGGVAAGPTEVVLTTKALDRETGLTTQWRFPHVRYSRGLVDFATAVRSVTRDWGIRRLLYPFASPSRQYQLWRRHTLPRRAELHAQRTWADSRSTVLSLVTFVAAPSEWPGTSTSESVSAQSYPHWEWIIVVANGQAGMTAAPPRSGPTMDARIRSITTDSDSRALGWNMGLRQARGEFVALLDGGDVLAPSALYEMARAFEDQPDCDLVYSDEETADAATPPGRTPHFKPDWSPELLLSTNYVGRLAFFRRSLAVAHDGFRADRPGAEEWDLLLRLSDVLRAGRIPRCLYARRNGQRIPSPSVEASVIADHGLRHGLNVTVFPLAGTYRSSWPVRDQPRVSIVIPNRNATEMITRCVRGLLEQTDYQTHDLVIVDNGSTDPGVLAFYREVEASGRLAIVRFDRPFNYSAACNAGAAAARGELLLFLNNDTEVIDPDWLSELVRWAQQPHVGVVGAKLLYPDRTIQHAGVVFGLGLVGHIFSGATEGTDGLFGSTEYYRNYLAVTGACQMIRRDVFERVGGYDERFRLSFSDVVFCMEAWRAGYRVVYTPFARLIHHESSTRGRSDWPEDLQLLVDYLRKQRVTEDPYLHPELNPASLVPMLRPPFAPSPRQAIERYLREVPPPDAAAGARRSNT
jgi:GT2 family glycosyltransferase